VDPLLRPRRAAAEQRRRDLNQGADGDNAADRIGDAHQRRVQRGRDVPHHHVTDKYCQHEYGEVAEEGRRRVRATNQNASAAMPNMTAVRVADAGALASPCFGALGGIAAGLAAGRQLERWRRPGDIASLMTVRPRMASSSILTLMTRPWSCTIPR